jgi:copper resistance protein C
MPAGVPLTTTLGVQCRVDTPRVVLGTQTDRRQTGRTQDVGASERCYSSDDMSRALAVVVALVGVTAVAAAHGVLERTEPRAGSIVKSAPAQVRLQFTGAIEPAYSQVRVLDGGGHRVDLGDSRVDADNRALLRVSLPALAPGRYKVAWRVLSVDSHVTEGDFTFRVAQ